MSSFLSRCHGFKLGPHAWRASVLTNWTISPPQHQCRIYHKAVHLQKREENRRILINPGTLQNFSRNTKKKIPNTGVSKERGHFHSQSRNPIRNTAAPFLLREALLKEAPSIYPSIPSFKIEQTTSTFHCIKWKGEQKKTEMSSYNNFTHSFLLSEKQTMLRESSSDCPSLLPSLPPSNEGSCLPADSSQ